MTSTEQANIELSAVLNLIPYLDAKLDFDEGDTLEIIITKNSKKFTNNTEFKLLKQAVDKNPEYKKIQLINQSSTNDTAKWTDDPIQACTFKTPDGDYYVAYRGTGAGRWPDNGDGMTEESTYMQRKAQEYFDEMAEKYFIDAHVNGNSVYVTGHSKGGNEAQYVYMMSDYAHLIDACYSLDGQGFSDDAIAKFKEIYGDRYEEKLANMYSICGQNDYVHDLGYVIIPEENTYFVETNGNGFADYHHLYQMLCDEKGNYINLQWDIVDGQITHGEQGPVGAFAKKLSEAMMKMDDENLHGVALAIMDLIDPYSNENTLGEVLVSWEDYVDLFAKGLPVVIATLLGTEEGHDLLFDLTKKGLEALYKQGGDAAVAAGFAILAAIVTNPALLATIVGGLTVIAGSLIVLANLVDFAIDVIDKLGKIATKIKEFISDVRKAVHEALKKIKEGLKSLTPGHGYSADNPQIVVDTYKLDNYAQRLQRVQTRIKNLDRRLDSLYWKVGLLDLWDLMQGDILTGFSARLALSARYLTETAKDFNELERALTN